MTAHERGNEIRSRRGGKRRLALKLLLTASCLLSGVLWPDAEPTALGYGVPRLNWVLAKPRFTYAELVPTPTRVAELKAAGHSVVCLRQLDDLAHVRSNGLVRKHTRVYMLLDDSGIQGYGNGRFAFDGELDRAAVTQAYTLTPDGKVHKAERSTVGLLGNSSADFFTSSLEVVVPFKAVVPGAITVLEVKVERHRFPSPWSFTYLLTPPIPVEQLEVDLMWGTDESPIAWRYDAPVVSERRWGLSHATLTASRLEPLPLEVDGIPLLDRAPQLIVAQPYEWREVIAKGRKIMEKALGNGIGIRQKLDELVAPTDDTRRRVEKIHAYVARKLRYTGLEMGSGAIEPRSTKTAMERGFGDCKDKTMLFVALLREAGVPAWPALTSTERSDPSRLTVPSLGYFDHVIACYFLGGKEYCTDLTAPQAPYTEVPAGLSGAVRLLLRENTTGPDQIPTLDHAWHIEVNADRTLREDGSVEEIWRESLRGDAASAMRSQLLGIAPDLRQKWALARHRAMAPDQRFSPKYRFENVEETGLPLGVVMTGTHPAVVLPGATELVAHDVELASLIRAHISDNSESPLRHPGLGYLSTIRYHLPEGFGVASLGPRLAYSGQWASLSREYTVEGRRLTVKTQLRIPRAQVSVAELKSARLAFEAFAGETRHRIELVRSER